MKRLTLDQIVALRPCWLDDEKMTAKLYEIGARQEEWSALDVLALPDNEVSAEDKLWLVLRKEFIDEPILHEFACQCAESALALIENPDPRSIAAIDAKRKWLKGEIDDNALATAWAAAWATAETAAWAAWATAVDAATAAAWAAADAAGVAADAAGVAAKDTAWSAARDEQIAILIKLLNAQK